MCDRCMRRISEDFVSYRDPAPLYRFVILGATVAAVFSVSLGPFVLMGQMPQASAQSSVLWKREGLRVCTLVISENSIFRGMR